MIELSLVKYSKDNKPTPRMLTKQQLFLALSATPEVGDWDGPAFCPASFVEGGLRRAADVRQVNLLVFDIDGPKLYDKRHRKWLIEQPSVDTIDHIINHTPDPIGLILSNSPAPGICYTSWSHRWAKVFSYRLVLYLPHPVDPTTYKQLWLAVYEQLGGRRLGLDGACKDPCRLFFLFRRLQLAQDLGLETPFMCFEFEAQCPAMLDRWF